MPSTRDPAGSVAVAFMALGSAIIGTFLAATFLLVTFLVSAFIVTFVFVTFVLVTSIIVSFRQGERRRDEYAVLHFTSHVSPGAGRTQANFVGRDFHALDPVGCAVDLYRGLTAFGVCHFEDAPAATHLRET